MDMGAIFFFVIVRGDATVDRTMETIGGGGGEMIARKN